MGSPCFCTLNNPNIRPRRGQFCTRSRQFPRRSRNIHRFHSFLAYKSPTHLRGSPLCKGAFYYKGRMLSSRFYLWFDFMKEQQHLIHHCRGPPSPQGEGENARPTSFHFCVANISCCLCNISRHAVSFHAQRAFHFYTIS